MSTSNVSMPENTTPVAPAPATSKANGKPTYAELQARIQQLEQQQAASAGQQVLTFKTSSKSGGMILYGLQRFPVTLKESQWRKLVAVAKDGTIDKALALHVAGRLQVKQVTERE